MSQFLADPPTIRIRHYRDMAAESFRLAAGAPVPDMKAGFLDLAASWGALADQVERQAARAERVDRTDFDTSDNAPRERIRLQ